MLNLREYRNKPTTLADYLPWAALVAPGVVLNKDGSFQRTARFRGPDLESATPAELIAACARLNNALRRLGSGWALFVEAERYAAADYPDSTWPDPVSWLVDQERRAAFEGHTAPSFAGDHDAHERRQHFESAYHLTLVHLPPAETARRFEALLLDRPQGAERVDGREHLENFIRETNRLLDLVAGLLPELEPLDDAATLTYLHGTISTKRHPVGVPETPMHLDAVLADTPLVGGLEPRLGDQHLRTLTIQSFPGSTTPGLLDELNQLGSGYRWVVRFLPLDKAEATKALTKYRRLWFAKRKSVAQILREMLFQEQQVLVDSDADNKASDADADGDTKAEEAGEENE